MLASPQQASAGTPFSVKDILNLTDQAGFDQALMYAQSLEKLFDDGMDSFYLGTGGGGIVPSASPTPSYVFGDYVKNGYQQSTQLTSPHVQSLSHLCPPFPSGSPGLISGGYSTGGSSDYGDMTTYGNSVLRQSHHNVCTPEEEDKSKWTVMRYGIFRLAFFWLEYSYLFFLVLLKTAFIVTNDLPRTLTDKNQNQLKNLSQNKFMT